MKNQKKEIKILYVDDEIENLNAFKATFRRDYTIHVATSAEEGRKILDNNNINIILADQRMPNTVGSEFLASIIPVYPDPIRMLLTGYSDLNGAIDAINNGQIYKYLTKPWDVAKLKMTIDEAYDVYTLREQKKELIKVNEQLASQLKRFNEGQDNLHKEMGAKFKEVNEALRDLKTTEGEVKSLKAWQKKMKSFINKL